MIPVTKPFLPPFDEYQELVRGVFERNWLTNDEPLVRELESKLSEHGITICDHVVIGAGAVVTEDITKPGTYVGVPAKRVS